MKPAVHATSCSSFCGKQQSHCKGKSSIRTQPCRRSSQCDVLLLGIAADLFVQLAGTVLDDADQAQLLADAADGPERRRQAAVRPAAAARVQPLQAVGEGAVGLVCGARNDRGQPAIRQQVVGRAADAIWVRASLVLRIGIVGMGSGAESAWRAAFKTPSTAGCTQRLHSRIRVQSGTMRGALSHRTSATPTVCRWRATPGPGRIPAGPGHNELHTTAGAE